MSNPLVSVIVLCYNQALYVEEAIQSVLSQEYQTIEIIVVDDASRDGSKEIISRLSTKYYFKTIYNEKNLGNCASFNMAFKESKGKYIIDLAADDILLPSRISTGAGVLEKLSEEYGVHFCDAEIIQSDGGKIKTHYIRNGRGKLLEEVPDGWIFKELVERFFICTPTMMIRRKVYEKLDGYDENLSYEDFDFWVRSSRDFQYVFSDKVLVRKRTVKKSLSSKQKFPGNKHIYSTALVCKKAFELCQNKEEFLALKKRIQYELKWAAATGNFKALAIFLKLFRQINRKV